MTVPPTLVLDLDGTLVDTAGDLTATLNDVLAGEGLAPVPFDAARAMVGHGARAMLVERPPRRRHHRRAGPPGQSRRGLPRHLCRADRGDEPALPRRGRGARPLRRRRLAARSLHQQARTAFAASPHRDRHRRPISGDRRPGYLRRPEAGPAPSPGDDSRRRRGRRTRRDGRRLRKWTSQTARAARVPVVAVDFGYSRIPVIDLAPDRVISHFDDLYPAATALLPDAAAGLTARRYREFTFHPDCHRAIVREIPVAAAAI